MYDGTLVADFSAAGAPTSNILGQTSFKIGSATLTITGAAGASNSQALGATNLGLPGAGVTGNSVLVFNSGASGGSLNVNLGTISGNIGCTVDITLPSNGTVTTSATSTTVSASGSGAGILTSSANSTADATLNGGTDFAAKDTNFNIVSAQSLGLYTSSSSSALANANIDVASGVDTTLTANTPIKLLRFNDVGESRTISGSSVALSLPSSILVTPQVGAGTSTVSTNIKFGNTAQTGMNVFQYNIGAPLILSGTLSYGSASSGPLTKVGPGELIISGINNSYTGLTILNGGITNIAADLSLGAAPTTAVANQLTFNGGTLQLAGSFDLATTRGITVNPAGATIDTQSFTSNYAGAITLGTNFTVGSSILTKLGSGTLKLSGISNGFTGATLVKAGTLIVSGGLSGSPVTVGDSAHLGTSAVLGGGGTVGAVTVGAATGDTGATLNPHAGLLSSSPGVTLSTGALTFADGSANLSMQLGRTSAGVLTAGDVSDHLQTSGAVSLNGANLQLSLLSTYTPVAGDILYLIINNGGTVFGGSNVLDYGGTALTEGSQFVANGYQWQIGYLSNFAASSFDSGGHDIALEVVAAVPEPETWAAIASGFAMLLGIQKFRKSRVET